MDIKKIIGFLKCPSCVKGCLKIENKSIYCISCLSLFDTIEGVPILIKKDNLCHQELNQLDWFNKHYSNFSQEKYNLENWRLSMLDRIFETGFKKKVKTYLDIGCGATGYTVIEAARRNHWLSFGVDISIEAILRAKNLAKKQGLDHLTVFLVCSAENLPFGSNLMDYISAVSLLEHLENDEKTIRSLYSILKVNGHLYVCVPNSYRKIQPFLWPIYLYFDHKVGHKRHYSIVALNNKMKKDDNFELERVFYNGHLIKLYQIFLDKLNLINPEKWWLMEKQDINKNPSGVQLNAIYRKK